VNNWKNAGTHDWENPVQIGSWGKSSKKLGVDFPAMFEPTRCKRPTVSDSNEVSHVLPAAGLPFDEKPGEWFSVQKPCHHALMSSGEFRNVLAVLRLKLFKANPQLTAHDSISVYIYIHTHMGTYMALYHFLYIPIIHL